MQIVQMCYAVVNSGPGIKYRILIENKGPYATKYLDEMGLLRKLAQGIILKISYVTGALRVADGRFGGGG